MPREEQMMLEHFGNAYRAYLASTGRFLPTFGKGSLNWADQEKARK